MISLRSLARAAPRAVPRTANSLHRPVLGAFLKPVAAVARSPTVSSASPFTTSALRAAKSSHKATVVDPAEGDVLTDLTAKLDSEIKFEEEVAASNDGAALPTSIKDFLDNSAFELHDTPGSEEVQLKRNYKDEKITVTFSISGLGSPDDLYDQDDDDDAALGDEGYGDPDSDPALLDGPPSKRPGAGSAASKTPAKARDDDEDFDDEFDGLDDEEDAAAPSVRLSIVIEKPGRIPGAVSVDAQVQHGTLIIDMVSYWKDASQAHDADPAASLARSSAYSGPPFGSLDEELQSLMERYLEVRGIGEGLSVFVAEYLDHKEQKEYMRWLNNVKTFFDA